MSDSTPWAPLRPADLPALKALADEQHADLPERLEVFAERLHLFPAGCRALFRGDRFLGYGLAHPWTLHAIPPLDDFLHRLPAAADCLYVHDIVVHPDARGAGASARYLDEMTALARSLGLPALTLTSVYGTAVHWRRFGFAPLGQPDLTGYGPTAVYLVRDLRVNPETRRLHATARPPAC